MPATDSSDNDSRGTYIYSVREIFHISYQEIRVQ